MTLHAGREPDDYPAAHIPLLDYADQGSKKHQVEQVRQIYKIVEGREVVALAGHTYSIENLREGDFLTGCPELFGIDAPPVNLASRRLFT